MGRKLVAALGVVLLGQIASANSFLYTSALNGFQEVPSTNSQGVAVIQLTLDDTLLTASGTGAAFFLSGPATAFLINDGPFGSSGPVVIAINPGSISGNSINFSATLPSLASFQNLKAILDARNGYFNIHTSSFAAGEIRGQIAPVPEPMALAVVGVGLVTLVRRRRRRSSL